MPGWKRPSIAVPVYSESSASRHLSPSGAASSMPWPAISPKEAVTAEQEAWCVPAHASATLVDLTLHTGMTALCSQDSRPKEAVTAEQEAWCALLKCYQCISDASAVKQLHLAGHQSQGGRHCQAGCLRGLWVTVAVHL